MAGHSKWANIQYRKNAQDKRRGKIFTRLIREITVATRMGGADPDANPRLRLAIDKALGNNMPKDNIERAIKRGSGDADGQEYDEVRYEGYGPGGVAILLETLTDNRNRTVAEVRHTFSRHGGNLGADGSVAYLFSRSGVFHFDADTDDELVLAVALEAGAEDIAEYDDGSFDVLTSPEEYQAVKQALAAADFGCNEADVTMRAATTTELEGDLARQCLVLLDALEDLDDVQNVYSNADFAEEILQAE
ncbi:MAG: YebC/PmpR family DNA-binding transcriptional regulator [Salinisphaera sp.]|nr:YebC/PmpR family DNA-binding transcriptional regulator [Salinisphaera sp.]